MRPDHPQRPTTLSLGAPPVLLGAALLAAIGLAGCGSDRPELYPVTGTVTLDGRPVEGASVGFSLKSGGRPAAGTTDKAGRFVLGTFEMRDGALPGAHVVTVTKRKVLGAAVNDRGEDTGAPVSVQWLVPQVYSSRTTSELRAEVGSDENDFEFNLKSQ